MTPYTFYLPSTLAARIIANELAQWRDEIHYANEQEGLRANEAMNQEKVIEEMI
jgi:hypothetical protein